jgi:phosphoribosylformylglycinamidine synthase
MDLEKAPLKYAGLAPWEILVSEAQERMTLSVPPENLERFLALARRREVEATDLGAFTDDGFFHVTHGGETVALLQMEFLHDGDPDLDLKARWAPPSWPEPTSPPPSDLGEALLGMARRLNLASGESKARHYDHEVKGLTVVKPWVGSRADVPAEATVFLARHGSLRGYVLSEGVNPYLSDVDAEAMARAVVDEAVRRQICGGAAPDRIALLDNFCWPDPVEGPANPDGAYKAAQLVRACRGLHDLCVAYGTPLVSGKDSMKNDSTLGGVRISVPPTLLVSALGQIDDVRRAVTLDVQNEGDLVYYLGVTRDETGGSEYFRWLGERDGLRQEVGQPAPYVGNKAPRVDPSETLPLYRSLAGAIRDGLVRSAATPARGGLAWALARMALAGRRGVYVELDACPDLAPLAPDVALFSESCGRFVVTVAPEDAARFESRLSGLPCRRIGVVSGHRRVRARLAGGAVLDVDLSALGRAWKETFADV